MLRQNLMCTIIFLFVLGVEKVEPLNCYSCSYSVRGNEEQGPRACKNLRSSDANIKYLVRCDNLTNSYYFKKGSAVGTGFQLVFGSEDALKKTELVAGLR